MKLILLNTITRDLRGVVTASRIFLIYDLVKPEPFQTLFKLCCCNLYNSSNCNHMNSALLVAIILKDHINFQKLGSWEEKGFSFSPFDLGVPCNNQVLNLVY
jgi:hypothetical protein